MATLIELLELPTEPNCRKAACLAISLLVGGTASQIIHKDEGALSMALHVTNRETPLLWGVSFLSRGEIGNVFKKTLDQRRGRASSLHAE